MINALYRAIAWAEVKEVKPVRIEMGEKVYQEFLEWVWSSGRLMDVRVIAGGKPTIPKYEFMGIPVELSISLNPDDISII